MYYRDRYAGICRMSTKKYRLHAKHMKKIVYNLNNTIPHNVRLVDPFRKNHLLE